MKNQLLILLVANCLGLSQAFALFGDKDKDEKEMPAAQSYKFDDLRATCANPTKYHNQVAPSNIQINCAEVKSKWVAEPQLTVMLPVKRLIVTGVVTNKYSVAPVTAQVAADPQAVGCYQYKEVLEAVETVHATTCDQINNFQGTGEEYCATSLDSMRVANPDAIKVTYTGKKVDFCNSKAKDQDQD